MQYVTDEYKTIDKQEPKRRNDAKTLVTLTLVDGTGEDVAEDEFELVALGARTFEYRLSGVGLLPLLRHTTIRRFDGDSMISQNRHPAGVRSFLEERSGGYSGYLSDYTMNLYVSPYALTVKAMVDNTSVYYSTSESFERRVKLSLDDLKRVQDVKCKVAYVP